MILAALIAFAAGFIALSHEILWYRVYSYVSMGAAEAFALMLGAYLVGIALGAYGARALCRRGAVPLPAVAWLLAASVLAYFLPPLVSWMVTWLEVWEATLPAVAATAALLGAVFPLISHAGVAPDERSGSRISYLYLANILGAVAGSLGTGFVLLDRWPLATVAWLLACASLASALALAAARGQRGARLLLSVGAATLVAALLLALEAPLYGSLYERLQYGTGYRPGERFAHVVENKSGVIAVSKTGTVFGHGAFDGVFDTSLNGMLRAYAVAGLHPAPRDVLMIGLSSGSWAAATAAFGPLERLTIVEINPGYLELLPRYPIVAGLLNDPRVRIEIDDARRWLVRNPARRFDVIVANGTFHWRAHATNLLSEEFVALVRSHLRPGGLYYFNATGSDRAAQTAASAFSHVLRLANCIAASDAPLAFDPAAWRRALRGARVSGHPVFEHGEHSERAALARIAELTEPEARLRARVARARLLTDDNMGSEWRAPALFR
jgi:spermidine synthase